MNEKKISLYGIGEEIRALEGFFSETQGEETEELKELHGEIEEIIAGKTDSYVGFANRLKDEIAAAKGRIKEMQEYVSVRNNAIDRMKEYIETFSEESGRTEFTGEFFRIKVGSTVSVDVVDENHLPVEFIKTTVSADRAGIKNQIKNGIDVPGARLIEKPTVTMGKRPVSKGGKR